LGDIYAYDLIIKYCGGLKYEEVMFAKHVDEKSKFKYKGAFEDFESSIKGNVNPKFVKLLTIELRHSKIFKDLKGFHVYISIDKIGTPDVILNGNMTALQKSELERIFKRMTEYKPAVYQGKNVNTFGPDFGFPLIWN
jgi:hypothetical protein